MLNAIRSPMATGALLTMRRTLAPRHFPVRDVLPARRPSAARIIVRAAGTQVAPTPDTKQDVSGASIRKRFKEFFEQRGHKVLPSSSLVPEDPTVLLTIAGMLQFKPIFMGQVPRAVARATTSQKCVRTNDIENVGVTKRHHTFFEMLGNFSFGDYFKNDAIKWAWELATKEFGLAPERVWVSVFEQDDEAFAIWRDEIGVPAERIQRLGEKDNFWAAGPTGPCGPCSELYFDFHPERGTKGATVEDDSRFIEFYNLVFMEFSRGGDGKLTPLANKNIDTGMGLERMAQILQKVPNNYETDLIFPIIQKAAELAKVDYAKADEATRTKLKVIGDHTRAVVYLISDGVAPSNVGRGYVVRRLLRRVVRCGRQVGISAAGGAFTPKVAEVAVALSGEVDPAVAKNAARVFAEMEREELRFVQTLERGEALLEEFLAKALAAKSKAFPGDEAFMLYDTYGFPVEITQEVAAERGLEVDMKGFAKAMDEQVARSQASAVVTDLTAEDFAARIAESSGETAFLGYESLAGEGRLLALLSGGKEAARLEAGQGVTVVLDRTPFYAESGGQVGDRGTLVLEVPGKSRVEVAVEDVQKAGGGRVFVHTGRVVAAPEDAAPAPAEVATVKASVDPALRRQARCNHTSTHLLQSALRQVLGPEVAQAGSLVDFDRLRFDFTCPTPPTAQQVAEVERLVNDWIWQALPLRTQEMGLQEAKAAGALAMFGEKYAERVRVVSVAEGVSMELCGGTHVGNTAEIGMFKVISEAGIASGVRRIEAVSGPALYAYFSEREAVIKGLSAALKVQPDKIQGRVSAMSDDLRRLSSELDAAKVALALAKCEALADAAGDFGGGVLAVVEKVEGVDGAALGQAAQKLQERLGDPSVVVLASTAGDGTGKVNFSAAFSPGAVKKGLAAGKLLGQVAKACGGGGGGKPAFAQAGGSDASKVDAAMDLARAELKKALGGSA